MLVRVEVEVFTALGTEPGAVIAAENLVRERERNRVVRPGGEVEPVVVEVLRPLVVRLGLRRLVLAQPELERQLGVLQAPKARAVERDVEGELEDGAARRTCDREFGGRGIRLRLIALPPRRSGSSSISTLSRA